MLFTLFELLLSRALSIWLEMQSTNQSVSRRYESSSLDRGYLSLNWSCDFDARPIQGQVTTVDLLITRRWTKQRFYCSTPIEFLLLFMLFGVLGLDSELSSAVAVENYFVMPSGIILEGECELE
ncbi:hypothetical protein K7X08_001826 [Anisodus acutangulus]|uniref:Uncharacterized protein n=1 Tax=Anisodus acutangulus TaxID=402998 RepID=A0A9Q1R5C7_9SOLA|nr:hypothetical protein K7X08_001826 [Anisodus acutangulus]